MPHSKKGRAPKKPKGGDEKRRVKMTLKAHASSKASRPSPAPGLSRAIFKSAPKERKDDKNVTRDELAVKEAQEKAPVKHHNASLTPLQQSMQEKLAGAHFRFLNEQLYTRSSGDAWKLIQSQPELWQEYHKGFALQAKRWPVQPVDLFIAQLKKVTDRKLTIVDFGCGEAKLAASLETQHTVHSFDLVAPNERVVACNMTAVPLGDTSADVAVFALALMGTDIGAALREAARVLRKGGLLKIAEVASRFRADGEQATEEAVTIAEFVILCEGLGFRLLGKPEMKGDYFVFFTFKRTAASLPPPPRLVLKPCIYKRR